VAQMRGSGHESPWRCQHGLQVLEAMHAMHIALLHGMGSAVERQQVSKKIRKIPEYGVRLALDLNSICSREQAHQIALNSSIFAWHAMAQHCCDGACHPQTHGTRQEWRTPRNQAVECQPVIRMGIPP